jgi:hypothetical protein
MLSRSGWVPSAALTAAGNFSLICSTVIFISHASAGGRAAAGAGGARPSCLVDSRNLRGGAKLAPEITAAFQQARQVFVVLSPSTVNSPWVRREIAQALKVEKRRRGDGYRVIPLLLPGITPGALGTWCHRYA